MKKKTTGVGWVMFCFLCFLLYLSAGFVFGAIPAEERTALIALYNATGGENWKDAGGWKGNNNAPDGFSAPGTEGTWHGITVTGDRVTAIDLSENNLKNLIPLEIGNFTQLKSLVLKQNYDLSGSLPTAMGGLGNLEVLDIAHAKISEVPAALGNLSSLKVLDLSNNYKISVPPELGNLQNLLELDLEWSYIGEIPSQWGNLANLRILNLKYNDISLCPPELGNLSKLQNLDLSYNKLTALPAEIGNLSTLKECNLYDNQLTGLPAEFGNLAALEVLDLTFNWFKEFPAVLGNLANLKTLGIGTCGIEGTLPAEIGILTGLERLDLSFNYFTGGLEQLAPLVNLKELVFYYNLLETIPPEIGCLVSLEFLDLHHNKITGTVPAELGNLVNLKDLDFGENMIAGIPEEIGNLTRLETLNLSDNVLTDIPGRLKDLVNLKALRLNKNKIARVFPGELLSLTDLELLMLSNNTIYGEIPPAIENLVNLKYLGLGDNELSGEIPAGIAKLEKLEGINLEDNFLGGGIPPELFDLPHLYDLWLGGNKLSGMVPPNVTSKGVFWSSWGLLDISYNALYSDDPEVNDFLNGAMNIDNWMKTQTVAPENVWAKAVLTTAVKVSWSPILFNWGPGGYVVYYSTEPGGSWNYAWTSSDKTASSFTVDWLEADTVYYFKVKTKTPAHASNKNEVVSGSSVVVSASTSNVVPGGDLAPFGNMELPLEGAGVYSGSIAVSGWALDDVEVTGVKIYNVSGGGREFIGDAVFVEGARPDVAITFPGVPFNNRAGWGYMMLTNFLPNKGNGSYLIMAAAYDHDGNETLLGIKSIVCNNLNAVLPFGAIDTPVQGGIVSGASYVNYGWVLTPRPNTIPVDGSTIEVWVDGIKQPGNPVYNNYRQDIASFFPGYNNSEGAVGYYYLDTTGYTDGLHTIQWTAVDDAGNRNGIGSRFFNVQNLRNQGLKKAQTFQQEHERICKPGAVIDKSFCFSWGDMPVDEFSPVRYRKGYNLTIEPEEIYSDENGEISIQSKPLQRIEVHLAKETHGDFITDVFGQSGYMVSWNSIKPLPVGSTYDAERGIFYWQPGPGFYGRYRFVFIVKDPGGQVLKKIVNITIN